MGNSMQTAKFLFPQPSLDMKRYTQTYFSDSEDDIFDNTKENTVNVDSSIKKDTVIEDNKNLEYWLGFTNCW